MFALDKRIFLCLAMTVVFPALAQSGNVNIEVVPGENVTLFSTSDPNWTSFDCRKDSNTVVLYRQNKIMPKCCPQYEDRVLVLRDENLLSVVLTNVTHKDSGNYTCELLESRDEAKRQRVFSIILKVADAAGHPVWISIGVVLCIFAVSGVVFGVVHRKKITECFRKK